MAHQVALAMVSLGTAVIVASALGALAMGPDPMDRLHYVTPMTSVGVPILCGGLCVQYGWGITAGQIIVIGALLFLSSPLLGAATGSLIAEQEGRIRSESPE